MPSAFRLQKWYLDVVSDDGRVFIGYAASVRWWLLSIHYFGYLHTDESGQVWTVNHFRRASLPQLDGHYLRWHAPGVEGRWQHRQPAVRETLLNTKQGGIDWNCLMPLADAEVTVDKQLTFRGRGYVEQMNMTLPPWRLPLSRLHWGRCLGEGDSAVWIRWVSPTEPRTLVFHNGNRYDDAAIETDVLRFGQNQLRLSESQTLRSGSLGSTVLTKAGWMQRLVPKAVRSMHETKWLSRGILEGKTTSKGWAIHEVVDWK